MKKNNYRSHTSARITARLLVLMGLVAIPALQAQTWNGGSGNWSFGPAWTSGISPNSNTADVFIDGGNGAVSQVALDGNFTVGRLTIDADDSLSFNNGAVLNLAIGAFGGSGTLVNNGSITLGTATGGATLNVANGSTLTGGGVITLSNNGNNTIQGTSTGAAFTIALGAAIRGTGTVSFGPAGGTNMLRITNQGLIDASNATSTLNIRMDSGNNTNLTNTGTLRASGGGTLRLYGSSGNVFNTGGVIEALDGSTGRIANSITVDGGTVTSSGTGAIRGDTAGGGGGRLSNVTNNGTVALANGETLSLAGVFTNNGVVRLDSTGSGTTLSFANGTTLTGPGVVTLSNNGSNIIQGVGTGDNVTIAAGAVIQGAGQVNPGPAGGSSMAEITNDGLIDANISGAGLSIRAENFNATALTNTGTLRASNGGTLTLFGTSALANSDGIVEALTGSTVRINSGITIEGGTVTSSGTGVISGATAGSGGGTLSNVANTGTVAIAPGEVVGLAGTLTNNGLVRLDSTGNAAQLLLRSNVTIAGTGSILMSNDFNNLIAGENTAGFTLTLAPGATIQGGGHIGGTNNNFNPKSINIVNQGLIESTLGMTIFVYGGASSDLTNSGGTLRATGTGIGLSVSGINGGTLNNSGGVIEACNGGTVSLGATLTNYNSPTQTLTGGVYLANAGTLSLNIGAVAINAGTVVLSGSTSVFTPINSIVQNDGIFVVTNGRTFVRAPFAIGEAPSTTFPNAGTLIVGPGDSSITLNNDYSQGAGSTLEIVIGADYPNASFHHLNVTGTASLAGTLEVKLANGYVPAPGQMFEIIHASAINGGFVSVNGATVTYTPTGVFINATGNTNALQLTKAVSRKTHGSAGALDVDLPLTGAPGVECRSSGGNHTLVFTFSNNIVSGDVSLTSGLGMVAGTRTVNGKTMSVDLSGVADVQQLALTLSSVTDTFAQVLPSTTVQIKFLQGDTSGNSFVNASDVGQTKAQSGMFVTQANCRQDVTVNGLINASDIGLVKSRSGASLP